MQLPPVSYTIADQERMALAASYFAWQSRLDTRELGRRVLEIGCGLGNFTSTLLDRETVVAIDIEPDCVERLKRRYPNRENLHAFSCDINDSEFVDLKRFKADSCVCLNVLEHIEHDQEALQRMASAIAPGGVIVLIVPAFPALYGPIDRNVGHYRRYTRASFLKLAQAVGLRTRKAHYMNTVGFFGWWANSHIFKREAQSEGQIKFFDKFIVPPMAWAEGIVRPFFGQSLFVALEKP
jgi:2-polyprenyl-3-methyl-5-hydroxy-6-metoxy-1,4-benzoquinol methylase